MHICSCDPFLTPCFHRFPRAHSPHPPCVRTTHAPSLTCCICHTLATNRDILLASVCNRDQGDTIWAIVVTPTPNSLRSSWDFLPGRSPNMLAGPTPSAFLVQEGGPDDKLCPLIMDSITLIPPWCLSHAEPLNITRDFFDLLSEITYDGEGKVAWPKYLEDFYIFLENADEFYT